MNFSKLTQVAPALIESRVSVELLSSPGRGKSEFVTGLPAMMAQKTGKSWGFATMFLATQTPTDMMGFMVPERVTYEGKQRLLSTFTMPLWMQTVDGKLVSDYEHGVLFLDEYGQGEGDTKRASAELLLNRKLGPHALPPGWVVWAASNRSSDRSGVTKSFDFVINRRVEISIDDDIASWEDWALDHGISPIFLTFAKTNPQIVFSEGVPDKQGPWCTPRSLVMCERILKNMQPGRDDNDIPTTPEANEVARGMIGDGAAAQLFATVKLANALPAYKDIISNPDKCKVPDKPDAQMLVVYTLASRVTVNDIEPVFTYINRFRKEFGVTFAKAAIKRDYNLVDTKGFGQWCVNNEALLSVLNTIRK